MAAIEKLWRGKAAGIDGMINEIFMYGGEHVAGAVHKLFAQLWEMEEFPTEWSKGLICPIFKGGSAQDKLNRMKYRGITLLSVVGKLFKSVLKTDRNNGATRTKCWRKNRRDLGTFLLCMN